MAENHLDGAHAQQAGRCLEVCADQSTSQNIEHDATVSKPPSCRRPSIQRPEFDKPKSKKPPVFRIGVAAAMVPGWSAMSLT
jgi:hypothetical protein